MAKVTAPLLSMGAAGQIGKTQVYASWRGVPYARRYVVPANPKTTDQTYTRSIFLWLNEAWKVLAADVQAVWTAAAKGQPMTDRNLWQQNNLPELRNSPNAPETDLALMTISPGVNAGLAAAGVVPSDAGGHHFTMTLTAPNLPAGWTITKTHAICWQKQDASADKLYQSYYAVDATNAHAPSIATGAAATYDGFAYFEYTKPDGSIAFSPSIHAQQIIA